MKQITEFLKKFKDRTGELTIAVGLGIVVFTFSCLLIQDFGNTYVKPYLDAKSENPDAVISIELSDTPRYEHYIIENGVIEERTYEENNNTPESIYDEDTEIVVNYQGPRNSSPATVIPIKPSYTGEGIVIFDDGSTWDDVFPPESVLDKWDSNKGQEKLIKITSQLLNKKSNNLDNFVEKNFLENIANSENADIDKDINEAIEDLVIQNSAKDNENSENINIVSSTLNKIYEGLKKTSADISDKSKNIFDFIREELKKKQMLADIELVKLRKEAEKLKLSRDYNEKIIKKYEMLESQGYTVTDASQWAEAKRRYDKAMQEIAIVEGRIEDMQIQKDLSADTVQSASADYTYEETTSTFYLEETTTSSTISYEETTTSSTQAAGNTNLPSSVALNGGFEEGPGSISLNIDFQTGKVTGKVSSSSQSEGYEISWTGDLNGSIDLESLEINGTGEGIVKVSGPEGYDGTGTLDCTFSGKLNNEKTFASGSMDYTENWYGSAVTDTLNWYASK